MKITANQITGLRGFFLLGLGPFLFYQPKTTFFLFLPGVFYCINVVLDGLDGYLARTQNQISDWGKKWDIRLDGLGVLLGTLVGIKMGKIPPWYLLAGGAYYIYHIALWIRTRLNKRVRPVPSNPARRFIAGINFVYIGIALLPWIPKPYAWIAGTLLMLPLIKGFVEDWLLATR